MMQLDKHKQEKQAFYLLTNDINNLLYQAQMDLNNTNKQSPSANQAKIKLNEISKLVQNMGKHLSQQ